MKAEIPGGVAVPGTTFACISCHTRSGLGAMNEGGLRTLPVNGTKLFQPLYPNFQSFSAAERSQMVPARFQVQPVRPAYTEATLAVAIRTGIDPRGRQFSPVMPRYPMDDRDMKILLNYLRNLSVKRSPGVTDSTIAFATVITDEVPEADRAALLGPLESSFQRHNNLGRSQGHMGSMLKMQEMGIGYIDWTLTRWILKGPSDTWQQQLEDYYRKEPVFVLVGGLSTREWEPIHRFCERLQIPCILPLTDLPVVSETDYYTLYFSRGYHQEGEAAARYVQSIPVAERSGGILQIADPGPESAALVRGFNAAWNNMGNEKIETVFLKERLAPDGKLPAAMAGRGKDSVMLLWTGAESYGALKALAAAKSRPGTVLMSSSLLLVRLWDLPQEVRDFTLLTYPFTQPGQKTVVPKMGGRPILVNREFRKNDRRIAMRTGTIVEILADALNRMERNFYRDHLLDLIDTKEDLDTTDYEKLSFSPGRRYLSDGCYIMQLSAGPNPTLIRRSEWALY